MDRTAERAGELAAILAEERSVMDEMAPVYRRWTLSGSLVYHHGRAAFVRWMLERLRCSGRPPAGLRFLDAGCGTGEILQELRDAGCRRLTGLDLTPAMLAEAGRHVPEAHRVLGILERPAFAPGSFDVMTAAFTVHHLRDPGTLFAAAGELLAPDGTLFVMDYNRDDWSATRWKRLAARILVAPMRFVVRKKNRQEIAAQPTLAPRFNPAHRLYDLAELATAAAAHGFEVEVVTRGLLAPWFLHDVFPGSRFDRTLVSILSRLDDIVTPRSAGQFQWLEARRRVKRA